MLSFLFRRQWLRRLKFFLVSDCRPHGRRPIINQPVLFCGRGQIELQAGVTFGVESSPTFYSGYGYVEARGTSAVIRIGKNVVFNNSCALISNRGSITIGNECCLGTNVTILDSDFHASSAEDRKNRVKAPSRPVTIGENVFIGNNVTILKGVTIGHNSIIGAGSVVARDIPADVIAGGNPCQVLRRLDRRAVASDVTTG